MKSKLTTKCLKSFSKITITGGSGFIGTNLVEYYKNLGWEVQSIDCQPPRNPDHKNQWENVNILDRDLLVKKIQEFQPEIFLHFAARTDLEEKINLAGYATNIDGVCNVIDAIRLTSTIQKVIFASSQLVCQLGYMPKHDYDYNPTTLYGLSKTLTERIIRTADDIGALWTIVRPTSIWGPWFDVPYKNFFMTIARNFYVHPGNISTQKQWGYVGNTVYEVDRLLKACEKNVHRKMFYLADYPPHNLRDFANQVQKSLNSRPIPTVPINLLKAIATVGDMIQRIGWSDPPLTSFRLRNIVTSEVQDLEPLKVIVGNLPYSLEQGVETTTQWLKAHGL